MGNWKSKLSGILAILLVSFFVLSFSASYLFYVLSAIRIFFSDLQISLRELLGWVTVGLSVSLLTSLTAWPFALAIVTLLEHNKSRLISRYFRGLINFMSSMPLLLFAYVYSQVLGADGLDRVHVFWTQLFASPNFFTKGVAFAMTLLFYPLTAIPGLGQRLSIDLFYREMLSTVIDLAEVGLVATIVVSGLFLFVLPKMVLAMRHQLLSDENLRSFEVIKSIGGTPWESIQLTVMQSMRMKFNHIILYFTRICFFEGLITFSLLFLIFAESTDDEFFWSTSLSSAFLSTSLRSPQPDPLLQLSVGILVILYGVFLLVENHFKNRRKGAYA